MAGIILGSGEVAQKNREKYYFRCGLLLVVLKGPDNKRNKLNYLIHKSDKCHGGGGERHRSERNI